jgi:hypothetical protein
MVGPTKAIWNGFSWAKLHPGRRAAARRAMPIRDVSFRSIRNPIVSSAMLNGSGTHIIIREKGWVGFPSRKNISEKKPVVLPETNPGTVP